MTTKEEALKLRNQATNWYNFLVDRFGYGGREEDKILKRGKKILNTLRAAYKNGEYDEVVRFNDEMFDFMAKYC